MTQIAPCVIAVAALGLSACTNPYDPVQRGFAGGLWGAASGAAIGAAAGGGPGAALGAAVGGATGVFGGVATTPPPPPGTYTATQPTGTQDTNIRAMRSRAMGTQVIRDTARTPVLQAMDTQVIRVNPAMDIRATGKAPLLRSSGLWISRLRGRSRLCQSPSYAHQGGFGQPDYSTPPGYGYPHPLTLHRATNAKAMKVILLTPTHRAMNTTVMRDTRQTLVLRGIYHRAI